MSVNNERTAAAWQNVPTPLVFVVLCRYRWEQLRHQGDSLRGHSRTVPSLLAVASVCPSGLNAAEVTSSVCPNRAAVGCPVAGSHSRTVRPPVM
jgi:hypothetical protein